MKRVWFLLFSSLLILPLALWAQQSGFKTIGLVSPRGYEAKLTPAGALQLTTVAPGAPTPVNPGGSPFDRYSFAYAQDATNQLQIDAQGKIHVTIDGVVGSGSAAWGDITGTLSAQTDVQAALDAKQASLGFTAENVANKSTNVALGTSNTTYSSTGAVKSYVDTVAATKQASLGFTAENVANKSTDVALGTSNTTYSSTGAVKSYVDTLAATKQATLTAGTGLGLSGATLSTVSTEAGFLADGGVDSLVCGSNNQGKMHVLDSGALEYCDGASTSVLRSLSPGVVTQDGLTWNVTVGTCTGDANTGKLTVNGSSEIVCASDIGGAGGASDITAVGSCLTNDCFTTGTPSASLTFNNATSGTVVLQTVAGALGTKVASLKAETGNICTDASVCSGYQATLGNAAADGVTLGKAAFVAADMNCTAGVCGIDYTNAQKATGSVPGFLTAADWTTFNAKQAAGAYATLTGVETLTNKRISPVVTTVASSVTFACNVDSGANCSMEMTGVAGTVTFAAPGGTPTPMQRILYRLKCTNAQTYAFNANFRFSATVVAPITCAAGKTDYLGAVYNDLVVPKWDVIAVDQGH